MRRLVVVISTIALVLLSCSPLPSTAPVQTFTTSPMSDLATPSAITDTPPAKATTIPDPSPTPSPSGILKQYDLPSWISDPDATVALTISEVVGNTYTLTFLNLATQETFNIPLSSKIVRGYFWTPDGKHFGLLSSDYKEIFLVDTKNGEVERFPTGDEATRFLPQEPAKVFGPLNIRGAIPGDFLFTPKDTSSYSANLQYFAHQDFQNSENPPVTVKDILTGATTQITQPTLDRADLYYSWSPIISLIGILQGTWDYGMGSPRFPRGNRIVIYKPDGEELYSYQGDYNGLQWSPDGSKLLFQETDNTPCILSIQTGKVKCLREITRQHSDKVADVRWTPSGNRLFYTLYDVDTTGLCIYDLVTGKDHCPAIGSTEFEKKNIEWFKVSPDERFTVMNVGNSCSTCDFVDDPDTFVLSTDGKNFYGLGKDMFVGEAYLYSYPMGALLWRP